MSGHATNRCKSILPYGAIAALFLALHLPQLFTYQSHADGDEARVGIMARHILHQHEFPVFYYGQHYNGGGAIEAYAAALLFSVAGTSNAPLLKLFPLFLWLATTLLLYRFVKIHFSCRTALLASLVFLVSTPAAEWCCKARGGYALTCLLVVLGCTAFAKLHPHNRSPRHWVVLLTLGLTCGIGLYNLEIILPFVVAISIAIFFAQPKRFRLADWLWIVGGFCIGYLPSILYNCTHSFMNIRSIAGQRHGTPSVGFLDKVACFMTHYVPSFFVSRNVDMPSAAPGIAAYLESAIYLSAVIFLAAVVIVPSLRKPGGEERPKEFSIVALLSLFVTLHLLFIVMSSKGIGSPRYLLPMLPALVIAFSVAVADLLHYGNRFIRLGGMACCCFLIIRGVVSNLNLMGLPQVNDDVLVAENYFVNKMDNPHNLERIAALLRSLNIHYVRTPYFISQRLLFESDETITACSRFLQPGDTDHNDSLFLAPHPRAWLFDCRDMQVSDFKAHVMSRNYRDTVIGRYRLFLPVPGSAAFDPGDSEIIRLHADARYLIPCGIHAESADP